MYGILFTSFCTCLHIVSLSRIGIVYYEDTTFICVWYERGQKKIMAIRKYNSFVTLFLVALGFLLFGVSLERPMTGSGRR